MSSSTSLSRLDLAPKSARRLRTTISSLSLPFHIDSLLIVYITITSPTPPTSITITSRSQSNPINQHTHARSIWYLSTPSCPTLSPSPNRIGSQLHRTAPHPAYHHHRSRSTGLCALLAHIPSIYSHTTRRLFSSRLARSLHITRLSFLISRLTTVRTHGTAPDIIFIFFFFLTPSMSFRCHNFVQSEFLVDAR